LENLVLFTHTTQNQTLKILQAWKFLSFFCNTKIAETAHSPSLGTPTLLFTQTTNSNTEDAASLEIPNLFLHHRNGGNCTFSKPGKSCVCFSSIQQNMPHKIPQALTIQTFRKFRPSKNEDLQKVKTSSKFRPSEHEDLQKVQTFRKLRPSECQNLQKVKTFRKLRPSERKYLHTVMTFRLLRHSYNKYVYTNIYLEYMYINI